MAFYSRLALASILSLGLPALAKVPVPELTKLESGVRYVDLKTGKGPMPTAGQGLAITFRAWLYADQKRGAQFESCEDKKRPYVFVPGQGQAIKGLEEGMVGMRVGTRRAIVIPAELAYGKEGVKKVDPRTGEETLIVPPNTPLLFEVELTGVR